MTTAFQSDAFQSDVFQIDASVVVSASTGGGWSGFNTKHLDLEEWRKNKRKLKAKIKVIERKIEAKREAIDLAPGYARLEVLRKQIAELQENLKELLSLLAALDEARKEEEEAADVMAIYTAWRMLH